MESRFEVAVEAPFRLDFTVWTLRRRPHNLMDRWDGVWYRRIWLLDDKPTEIAVSQGGDPDDPRLDVVVRSERSLPPERTETLRRALGLDVDLAGFWSMAARDVRLAALVDRFSGMRPPRFPSVFEALVNAIACQQLSLEVGIHVLNRLCERYGPRLPGTAGFGFPAPDVLAGADPEELRRQGFSRAKARAVITLAGQVAAGQVDLEGLQEASDTEALSALTGLAGIGRWSAEYTLLRGLGRWHVLPGDDVGARNNLVRRFALPPDAGYDALAKLSEEWHPYGGLVYFHLLLDGLAQKGLLSVETSGEPSVATGPAVPRRGSRSAAPRGRRR